MDITGDMFFRDATYAFNEQRKLKGEKSYNTYVVEETIALSSKNMDVMEFAKRSRSNSTSPIAFVGMAKVKPKVLDVE